MELLEVAFFLILPIYFCRSAGRWLVTGGHTVHTGYYFLVIFIDGMGGSNVYERQTTISAQMGVSVLQSWNGFVICIYVL